MACMFAIVKVTAAMQISIMMCACAYMSMFANMDHGMSTEQLEAKIKYRCADSFFMNTVYDDYREFSV